MRMLRKWKNKKCEFGVSPQQFTKHTKMACCFIRNKNRKTLHSEKREAVFIDSFSIKQLGA